MKTYRGKTALLHMSPMSITPATFPEWELPLYEEKHGNKLEITGDVDLNYDDAPDAQVVYEQLSKRGENDRGFSFVELAYGRGSQAVKNIEKAIKAAGGKKKAASKSKPKAEPKPEPKPEASKEQAEGDDPLG